MAESMWAAARSPDEDAVASGAAALSAAEGGEAGGYIPSPNAVAAFTPAAISNSGPQAGARGESQLGHTSSGALEERPQTEAEIRAKRAKESLAWSMW